MWSRLDNYPGTDFHRVKQFAHVLILKSHTSPGPIAARTVAVNEDVAAQSSVLKRPLPGSQCSQNLIILRPIDKTGAQPTLGMCGVRIAQTK